jgi:hypothetical protein
MMSEVRALCCVADVHRTEQMDLVVINIGLSSLVHRNE